MVISLDTTGLLLGIRPEKLALADQGLPVEVSAVDFLGAETILRLLHGTQQLMIRVEGRPTATAGDKLHVTWSPGDVHLFDQNGIRRRGQ